MIAVAELAAPVLGEAEIRDCIAAQQCPWCGKQGLRSLANHTVRAHQIYAAELRELAGLQADAPLCAPDLSDCHRRLAREHDSTRWLHQPEVFAAAAASREANYDDEQRNRRAEHLDRVRPDAIDAFRRRTHAERQDPELRAARRLARSRSRRAFRPGAECPICGAWFCSVVAVGQDYRQRKHCSKTCLGEAIRRLRMRTWMRRLESEQRSSSR